MATCKALTVALAAIVLPTLAQPLVAHVAYAGNCDPKGTERSGSAKKAKVEVKNNTAIEFSVRYYHGSIDESHRKKTLTLTPGDKDHQIFGLSYPRGQATVNLRFDVKDKKDVISCHFAVNNYKKETTTWRTAWSPGNCNLDELNAYLCPGCTSANDQYGFACQKSWNANKREWTTKFTIEPPGS